MRRFLGVLLLLGGGVSNSADFAVAPFLEAIPGGAGYDYWADLRVYALPDFRLVTRKPDLTGLTTVSQDGKNLFLLDNVARTIRTYEMPSLRLLKQVNVGSAMPYFDQDSWVREHPHRAGVLMLHAVFWIDANNGSIVETPDSLGVPPTSYHALAADISQAQTQLTVFEPDPPGLIPPRTHMIDLDDPRQVRVLDQFYSCAVMEAHGIVGFTGTQQPDIVVIDFNTLAERYVIDLPDNLVEPWYLVPIDASQMLVSMATADHAELVLLRLDLATRSLTEFYRHGSSPGVLTFPELEVRGRRVLLSSHSEIPAIPPNAGPLPGQVLQIDLDTGASTTLLWPHGGGPHTRGTMLATGTIQGVPIDAWAWRACILVLLLWGVSSVRRGMH